MTFIPVSIIASMVLALTLGVPQQTLEGRAFDTFGDVNCEDEMARLDNLAIQLQNDPQARAAIMFYGGKTFRGKVPRRGEAAARASRLISYLVERRGIVANRLILMDGGYHNEWQAELWIVPPGAGLPLRNPTVQMQEVKFRKGKASPREYRCEI